MEVGTLQQLHQLARDRRAELGLSQQAVADRAGVSRKWVSEFERGRGDSEVTPLLRLLAALDLRLQVSPGGLATRPSTGTPGAGGFDLDAILEAHTVTRPPQ